MIVPINSLAADRPDLNSVKSYKCSVCDGSLYRRRDKMVCLYDRRGSRAGACNALNLLIRRMRVNWLAHTPGRRVHDVLRWIIDQAEQRCTYITYVQRISIICCRECVCALLCLNVSPKKRNSKNCKFF